MNNLSGKSAVLSDMYVVPSYRRKGVPSALLNAIVGYAKDMNIGKVVLNATEQGRYVYEKYGFMDINGEMICKLK